MSTAENGTEKGSVYLTGEGAGVHDWRMSLDGTTWIQMTPSFSSKTTVNNLESNTDYYFQNRTVAAHNFYGEWSQSILITVK